MRDISPFPACVRAFKTTDKPFHSFTSTIEQAARHVPPDLSKSHLVSVFGKMRQFQDVYIKPVFVWFLFSIISFAKQAICK